MKISLGCDEAAYQLKETIKQHLQEAGHEVIDNGCLLYTSDAADD